GATGVAAFIKGSGLLEKMGIPLSYLDLLSVYDKGGFDAVKKLATDRQIINDKNEVVGYLAVDDPLNLDFVMKDLDKLGVTTYGFLPDSEELEIGIPLDLLGQYQTPDTLLKFLVSVAQVNHVVGF